MDKNEKEIILEGKIARFIKSEVGVLIAVLVFLFGIIAPYFQIKEDVALIQKDIAIINTNHEAHIQDILKNIEDLKKADATANDRIDTQQAALLMVLSREGYKVDLEKLKLK